MNVRSMGVAAVFLVGCAVGGVSSQIAVPKASAQQAATLSRWEYKCVDSEPTDDATATSNRLGAQNWEMTGLSTHVTCFKRPKM
jgi:hypothetical protein